MLKDTIIQRIYEDLKDERQSKICTKVLEYLLNTPKLCHITYGSIKIVINSNYTDAEILKAVQYLCGDSTNLLETGFEFIENEEHYQISKDQVKFAQDTGIFVHPQTGEMIDNYKEKVFMYFKPSSLIKEISK